jgi:hypothetical protein
MQAVRSGVGLFGLALLLAGCAGDRESSASLGNWRVEAESPAARVTAAKGVIDIDTPKGLSLWYLPRLSAPVAIEFEVMAVSEGGPNDQVSDVNAFWMASDAGESVLEHRRSGAFADYDALSTYYVGIGGNRNTTTRFRRYVGRAGDRPLLPGHDLRDAADLLVPNRWVRVRLIADGHRIAVERDGRTLFSLDDPEPYTRGHFALRTTQSHLRVRALRITRP